MAQHRHFRCHIMEDITLMPRPCSLCQSPHVREVDRRLKAGQPATDVVLYLESVGVKIHRTSVGRHARHTIGAVVRGPGPRPKSGSFLEAVRDIAWDGVESGTLHVTVRDGLASQAEMNRQADRGEDRLLMQRIAIALSGGAYLADQVRVLDPEQAAIEAEFRLLLNPGDDVDASTEAALAPLPSLRHRGDDGRIV